MASRAVLYLAGAVVGAVLGLLVVGSVSLVHPIALASRAIVLALGGK